MTTKGRAKARSECLARPSTKANQGTRATQHIAPRGAKKEEAFGGVILKSERPSGALFTNSGPPFFTVESKIEVLSPLGTSFH